jgi:hypothetical protein
VVVETKIAAANKKEPFVVVHRASKMLVLVASFPQWENPASQQFSGPKKVFLPQNYIQHKFGN